MENNNSQKEYKFSDILAIPAIRDRFEKVRKYFFLRESTYDMSNRCNIRCEGCYYFAGEKQFAEENLNVHDWQQLMKAEKERGITFVVLAGAESALVPDLCKTCYDVIPLGCIATNGLIPLAEEIDYRIHISVWGNDETSLKVRKAKNMLARQIKNYKNDARAIWVYTFTSMNIEEAREVTEMLATDGLQITFNMFSAPVGYEGHLRHTAETLARTRTVMSELLAEFPETVIFSPYNIVAHTHEQGLHDLFSCSYPRMNPSTDIGLGRSFRQYRTDLKWDRAAACCVPDTDCNDCRHYAAGSAVVTARMYRHADNPGNFSAWLDYVDTYLAVWVKGYEKGENLCKEMIEPPEQS
ncbi:MAG: radical SAM protein [Thermodesulfobacteriota bacterium]|nr:radical SAM protein [Thermodesulfobacteriota bacterium]